MNQYFDRFMVNIPSGYDKDAHETPALQLTGSGNVAMDGDILYVASGNEAATIDLHGESVASVVSQLPSGITATKLTDGMAELLLLPYQSASGTLPLTMSLPTNNLWFIVGAMARSKESRRRSLINQVAQINAAAATGRLLDWWGATLGVERFAGEPDSLFAQRIMAMKFSPNVNNVALENLFQTLGYRTQVTDTGNGEFSVNVTLPSSPPSGFFYTTSQLQSAMNLAKAAGVIASVILQGILGDTITVSDSLSYTLGSASWTVGSSITAGEFTV